MDNRWETLYGVSTEPNDPERHAGAYIEGNVCLIEALRFSKKRTP